VRLAMAGSVEDEAGNLPEHRVRPTIVRCPLCSSVDATFQTGRPFRMHLLSPAHSLTGVEVANIVEAAELLATKGSGCDTPLSADSIAPRGSSDTVELVWLRGARSGDRDELAKLQAEGRWNPLTATDRNGSSALHWAAGAGHVGCMRWLVEECGVPADQACTVGRADRRNALHWAARNGQTEACQWLVHQCGVPVDSMTIDATTPFHWACWQRHFGCCRWLRDNG
jgi:ankyrin repeat protein